MELFFHGLRNTRLCLLLALVLLSVPCYTFAEQGVTLTQSEYKMLSKNLEELNTINKKQANSIERLEMQLNVAKLSTNESKVALLEAKQLLEEQKKQLRASREKLNLQEQKLTEQQISLEKANLYLEEQKEEIKKYKKNSQKHRFIEVLLLGGLAYKMFR